MTIANEVLVTITDADDKHQASAKMLSFNGRPINEARIIKETGFTGTKGPFKIYMDQIKTNPNIRIDSKLGHELKSIRMKKHITLMDMSIALGIAPSELSKIENNLGALTDAKIAKQLMYFCQLIGEPLSDNPMFLTSEPIKTDIGQSKDKIIAWLENTTKRGS